MTCHACKGDGKETCDNPDHGFISAVPGDFGRLGCPVCGHDPKHKVPNGGKCEVCHGTGKIDSEEDKTMDDDKQLTQLWDAIAESEPEGGFAMAKHLFHLGYRLDPYPNGKSKGELIARIETAEAERDKTRNILPDLLAESKKRHEKDNEDASYHGSRHDATTCAVCIRNAKVGTFLAETSTVKP